MSPSQHHAVLEDHAKKIVAGHRVHINLGTQLKEVKMRGRQRATSSSSGIARGSALSKTRTVCLSIAGLNCDVPRTRSAACRGLVPLLPRSCTPLGVRHADTYAPICDLSPGFDAATSFFFNYNTVESVLLACAVLVNLAGILFESTRLQAATFSVRGCGPTVGVHVQSHARQAPALVEKKCSGSKRMATRLNDATGAPLHPLRALPHPLCGLCRASETSSPTPP